MNSLTKGLAISGCFAIPALLFAYAALGAERPGYPEDPEAIPAAFTATLLLATCGLGAWLCLVLRAAVHPRAPKPGWAKMLRKVLYAPGLLQPLLGAVLAYDLVLDTTTGHLALVAFALAFCVLARLWISASTAGP
ncbi:hypothetical protein [Pseudomonas typographi]|uniref:MFS transporter n=1 Tax=Pseudomonas typographi TaxID=2715964 RepID=A0ABR7YVR4_9PSED|nr:hypothetical protein [Pseudomonas typographi]MBD1549858.1 hypothetical protein [Pseudomonas typographi]MBD1585239.1 hypothetical protein [Pseudomonas typographi]MBD1597286.1 hypothetical protein [Pseudomonas typographi]